MSKLSEITELMQKKATAVEEEDFENAMIYKKAITKAEASLLTVA